MPDTPRGSPAPVLYIPRPSVWLLWHDYLFKKGARVLDLACGEGRHSLRVAQWGTKVIALDRDDEKLETGREAADRLGVDIEFRCVDLEGPWPELGTFDAVLIFNYLDRARMPDLISLVAPGGLLIMETFLIQQREMGWGPTSDDHLLQPGELRRLIAPLETVHGREVYEPVDAGRTRVVASIVAERRSKQD